MNRESLIHIVQTERYVVDVDPRKNRLYMRVMHEGQVLSDPSQFLETLHDVKYHLSNGFTMLMELCLNEAQPQREEPPFVHDAIDLFFEGGVRKIANVFQEHSLLQRFSEGELDHLQHDIQHRNFISRNAAEAWLDANEG